MAMQDVSGIVISLTSYKDKPFTGYYLGCRTFDTVSGESTVHLFKMKKDGARKEVYGFGTMNNILANQIPHGTLVEITYTGMENKKTKRGMKDIHMCKVKADFEATKTDSGKGKDYSTPVQDITKDKESEPSTAEDDDLPF